MAEYQILGSIEGSNNQDEVNVLAFDQQNNLVSLSYKVRLYWKIINLFTLT